LNTIILLNESHSKSLIQQVKDIANTHSQAFNIYTLLLIFINYFFFVIKPLISIIVLIVNILIIAQLFIIYSQLAKTYNEAEHP